MDKFVIQGGKKLTGRVEINGSKNASLPILAAGILASKPVVLRNVPNLRDVTTMCRVLESLGVGVGMDPSAHEIQIRPSREMHYEAPYDLIRQMRASFVVMGPLLAKLGRAKVALPGGCAIGSRPVDIHLKGFEKLGAKITQGHGFVEARADRLVGNRIYLDFPSVGATENIMMAAALAEGRTLIENAAREPEIDDLAEFLNDMGAKIKGFGTNVIDIMGVKTLKAADHAIIPDRIEAGTFLTAAAITGSRIRVKGVRIEHLEAVLSKLQDTGTKFYVRGHDVVEVQGPERIHHVEIRSLPYPGFPTDMQAQLMALLAVARGTSVITETVFENRFMHVAELKRMGASININQRTAVIEGVKWLSGAPVMATDLRAGAALVMAGLVAHGKTEISNIHHIDRGYENFETRLRGLGAELVRIPDPNAVK